mmetsp:Transcript_4594/g.12816  ORF Transcript_4594/g.12816 Transcript_4594/m.12816 type:complete len:197 (-) Transcript_4594:122-712(-)
MRWRLRPSAHRPAHRLLLDALAAASLLALLRGCAFASPRRNVRIASVTCFSPGPRVGRRSGDLALRAAGSSEGQGRRWSREDAIKWCSGFFALGLSSFLLPPDLKYATICYRSKQYTREYWDNPLNVKYAESKGMTQEEFEKRYLDDPMCEELGTLAGRYKKWISGQEHQRTDIPPEKRITKNTEFRFWFQRPPKE